jgi:serralysin
MNSNLTKILAFVAVMLLGFLLSHAVFGQSSAGSDSTPLKALQEVNGFRVANSEAPLTRDRNLDRAAERHAKAMADQDFFSHTGADGSIIGQRVSEAGYDWRLVAENIAAGIRDPVRVVGTWIDSPGHRKNMLLPGLRHAGLAHVKRNPDPGKLSYGDYWVLVLAAPAK